MYEYLFSQDSLIIKCKGLDIVIVPGQPCHVRSQRFKDWMTDGVIQSIYKSGVYVTYGHSHYFSMFTRGNTKWVPLESITSDLRFPTPRALKSVQRSDLPQDEESSDEDLPN